jgi:hypothetical protein
MEKADTIFFAGNVGSIGRELYKPQFSRHPISRCLSSRLKIK